MAALPYFRSFVLIGCGPQASPLHPLEKPAAARPELGTTYDPAKTGTIRGRVFWNGPLPESHAFRDIGVVTPAIAERADTKNPLIIQVNPNGNGVANAVVYLRKVDAAKSRPWDHPPLRVEMKDGSISIEQGQASGQVVGFVEVGDSIEMVSRSKPFEMLRARGAAYFTLAFPAPDASLHRALAKPGVVELSSGAGNYWARSFVIVAEHSYFARTDAEGNYTLNNVPEGNYEIVCWLPNWKADRFERDPENLNVARLWYSPPMETSHPVDVERAKTTTANVQVQSGDFLDKKIPAKQ